MSTRNILRDSLLQMYSDLPEVQDMLRNLDYSKLDRKFRYEIYARMPKEQFDLVDDYLHSEEVELYRHAIACATMSITRELTELIEFTISTNEGKLN